MMDEMRSLPFAMKKNEKQYLLYLNAVETKDPENMQLEVLKELSKEQKELNHLMTET